MLASKRHDLASSPRSLRKSRSSMTPEAEVTSRAERHLQLICLFVLVSVNVGGSLPMAARGRLVFITGGEMI